MVFGTGNESALRRVLIGYRSEAMGTGVWGFVVWGFYFYFFVVCFGFFFFEGVGRQLEESFPFTGHWRNINPFLEGCCVNRARRCRQS